MADKKATTEYTDPITGADAQNAPPEYHVSSEKQPAEEHVEQSPSSNSSESQDLHKKGALGFIQQQHTIPTTGAAIPTSKWEYIFFCIYCKCPLLTEPYATPH